MIIDVEKIIKTKSPKLHKRLPGFLIGFVKKIIHQDDINEILLLYGGLKNEEFITSSLNFLGIRRTGFGIENLAADRKYTFASNHPLGGLDALVLAEIISARGNGVRLVVNDVLMNLEPIKELFTPVNKYGRQNANYAKLLNDTMDGCSDVIYFPAGLCSRKVSGEIRDLQWKKGFISKSISSKRDIVPVWVDAVNSGRFYNISRFREFLGIKFNYELLLLPGELFRKRGCGVVNVYFGEPVTCEELASGEHTVQEWCDILREKSDALKLQARIH